MKLQDFENIVSNNDKDIIFNYLVNNIGPLFSTPFIPKIYRVLKEIDFSLSNQMMPKLIISWLAFLSGDHPRLFKEMSKINETMLNTSQESSMFYSLKALISSMLDIKEAIRYAKLSNDILPDNEISLFSANAKLTYGQILSGTDQYRKAAELFSSSYEIFHSLNLHFLAVVALVNKLLNLIRLGEYNDVIRKCSEVLLMTSSLIEEVQVYWEIVKIPLGICFFELNKPHLAIQHLLSAKKAIDYCDMLHMYGVTELYLFKSYYVIKDNDGMNNIRNNIITKFENLHHPQFDLLISMFNIYSNHTDIKSDIDRYELEYNKDNMSGHSNVLEILAYLKLKGKSDLVNISDLIKNLEYYKYIGYISRTQLLLLHLSELCLLEKKEKEANLYLQEALVIYKEYNISSNFYLVPLNLIDTIKKYDNKLYLQLKDFHKNIVNNKTLLLSEREKEIMMLIAKGKSNDEMSKELFISIGTIKWHINNIFSKLDVKNRVQAIEKAKTLGEI